jgi:hypothetical protein
MLTLIIVRSRLLVPKRGAGGLRAAPDVTLSRLT